MNILVTGFEPFGNLLVNPSQLIVEQLAQRHDPSDLATAILPTSFEAAGERIAALIAELRPAAVICLGVAAGRGEINLERVALNLDDSDKPDNAGHSPDGAPIVAAGPPAYWSSLPIERIRAELRAGGVPARISNHAGTYVCNHVFYLARHTLAEAGAQAPCGFIHVPMASEHDAESPLSLADLTDAVERCLAIVRDSLAASPAA